ncbi:MAG: alcohol dehydrogenase catalytic domain-containing protein, partial [Oscillospiraceae bacterium]
MKVKALECIGKKQIIMSEFEKPKVEYGCMLLKILSCGICGTDLHGIEGKRDVAYPFIPGHEIVAVVEEIGKNAEKTIKVFGADKLKTGMKVTINPRIVCNHCFFCKEMPQDPQKCLNALTATSIGSDKPPHIFGGFAEYLYVLPGSEIIAIDQKTDILIGALIEPFSCGIGLVDRHKRFYNAISGNGFQIVEPVVVYGTGAIGMLMIAAFKTAGAENIIAVDTSEERLQLSREFGANHTINVSETDSAYRTKQIRKITEIGAGIAVES